MIRLQEGIAELDENRMEELFPPNVLGGLEEVDNHADDVEENSEEQQLENLRDAIRRKEEIISLQKRLTELNKPVDETRSSYSFREIEDSLQTFSGDHNYPVARWIKSIDETKLIYNLNDSECFIYAKRLLRGTAKLFLRSTSCRSWCELKAALLIEFCQYTTATDVHNALRNRKKNANKRTSSSMF